ncbi:hypothetical protein D3272_21040 [Lichenibacterium ramalinae]|uniref:Uncharacterized protein n=1 Tax=Lichenibacterium ramalinae TaxID=2316527 RepID=A0A4Q2RA28_9HYPH|nr:hypothetical protein D3272_21040 [Lichenibacterium ramalinae]
MTTVSTTAAAIGHSFRTVRITRSGRLTTLISVSGMVIPLPCAARRRGAAQTVVDETSIRFVTPWWAST